MLILMDIDGVILQAHEGFGAEMREDTQWKGDDAVFFGRLFQDRDYLESLAGRTDFSNVLDRLLAQFDNPCTHAAFMKWWCYDLVKNVELMAWLEAAPAEVVLASNQERIRCDAIAGSLSDSDFYTAVYFSCDIGYAKPDARFFRHIVQDLNAGPDQVCFVDDSLANVEAARRLGIEGIHYKSNTQVIEEMGRVFA